jgi:hypothetical protein
MHCVDGIHTAAPQSDSRIEEHTHQHQKGKDDHREEEHVPTGPGSQEQGKIYRINGSPPSFREGQLA